MDSWMDPPRVKGDGTLSPIGRATSLTRLTRPETTAPSPSSRSETDLPTYLHVRNVRCALPAQAISLLLATVRGRGPDTAITDPSQVIRSVVLFPGT